MADVWYYGSRPANWTGYVGSTYSAYGDRGTWVFEAGFQAVNGWRYSGLHVSWSISFGGQQIGSGSSTVSVGPNGWVNLGSCSVTKYRTKYRQDFPISFSVTCTGAFAGTSTGYASDWIGPLESHVVSYDGAGATAPPAQTKWYGSSLVLEAAPNRTGYGFGGWKGSDGKTYPAGGTYETDADCTMTATWSRLYIPPACTLSAMRTADSTSTEESPSGEYGYVAASWAVDTSITASNRASSVSFEISRRGEDSWSKLSPHGTLSGVSGKAYARFSADAATAYSIRVTVTDSIQATSWETTLGTSAVAIDAGARGRSLGLLAMASDRPGTITVGGKTLTIGQIEKMLTTERGCIYGDDGPGSKNYIVWERNGLTVTLRWYIVQETSGYWTCPTKLPEHARSRVDMCAAGAALDGSSFLTNNTAYCFISHDGTIGFQSHGSHYFNAGTATWQI